MRRGAIALCAVMLAGSAQAATTIGEEKRFVVNATGPATFEVIRLQHMSAPELWCAAASHVQRRAGLPGTTAIYIATPLGASRTAPGRKAVGFTLDPSGLPQAERGYTLSVDRPGLRMTSQNALRYCRDAFTRSTK